MRSSPGTNSADKFEGLPGGGGINIAHEAVDRHADGPLKDKIALRWLGKDGEVVDYTYGDLKEQTNRFANLLRSFNVGRGDRVAVLAGRIPELYIAALGALKNVSVFCPLFSAFGPEPIYQRLFRGDAKVLVTTKMQFKKKIVEIRERLPELKTILITDIDEDLEENVLCLPKLMAKASPEFTIPPTGPEDMSCLHFTSGTTGMPKGAIHVHNAVHGALHDRPICPGSPPRRYLLVHGRPGVGDGHILRHHRPAAVRRHQYHRRSGI